MRNNIVIVGAGHAGGRCALSLRRNGFKGEITLIGEESSPPYERPPLSKGLLTGDGLFENCLLATEAQYAEQGINLVLDELVEKIDPGKRKLFGRNGNRWRYDKLVLATGGDCRRLACQGSNLENIFDLRTIEDSVSISSSLKLDSNIVIVGAGFIGLEVASCALKKGCNVTIVEYADQALGRVFPEIIAKDIERIHSQFGVSFLFDEQISALSGNTHVVSVALASGAQLIADVIVVGMGILPRTQLAQNANLEVENGITTNEFCQTSDPVIYAIGDCNRGFNRRYQQWMRLESWKNAEQQAEIVANHISGSPQPWEAVPWFWSDQYQYNIQMAGFFDCYDQIINRGALETATDPLKVIYFAMKNKRMVGAVAIGEGTSAARDLRVSQMIIERACILSDTDLEYLKDPSFKLKQMLKN